jgi:hypothetical protein
MKLIQVLSVAMIALALAGCHKPSQVKPEGPAGAGDAGAETSGLGPIRVPGPRRRRPRVARRSSRHSRRSRPAA